MAPFTTVTLIGWTTVIVAAFAIRTRAFATFVGVLLGIYSLSTLAMAPAFERIAPAFMALHVAVYLNFLGLARPRMRPLAYRMMLSWPASFFVAGALLALPWAVARAAGFSPWAPWLPYALAAVGLVQSFGSKRETVDLVVGEPHSSPTPIPHRRGDAREDRPLTIVQISDPHIGPFMSVARLRAIAQRAVDASPDLVLLTGDFLTMESQSDPRLLAAALEPLRALRGRVFACHGNHDHEALEVVAGAMQSNEIELLIDDARDVMTAAGAVQIVGMDFSWRDRAARLEAVCQRHPRKPGATRIVMLHDPGAFKHLPEGEGDLVLSGHTHGGQVGLVSVGFAWTFLRAFASSIPDHGFWARGRDRLWVHRGTGHYGFPLRLGVPAEESVLRIHRVSENTRGSVIVEG